MSACLAPDEVIDAVDGTLAGERRAHLASCATCQRTVDDVRQALALAGPGDVPEPPAGFWPSVNARVHAAITQDDGRRWWTWTRWDVVVPIAALALLVMAVASAIDGAAGRDDRAGEAVPATPVGAEPVGADGVPDDDALALVEDLANELPDGGWDILGVTRLPDLDVAAAALSDDERAALAALLQSAVERPTS